MGVRNATIAYVLAFAQAAISVAVVFGLDLSPEQQAAIITLVSAGGALAVVLNDKLRKE